MGQQTNISWTHHTFNPWIGCCQVSAGCDHCYAETGSHRRPWRGTWGNPHATPRYGMAESTWAEPLRWNRAAGRDGERRRVFCASLADVFEEHPQVAPWRERLWSIIEATPHLDWLLLTKRPQNIRRMLPSAWLEHARPNVWLGTTTELQRWADLRLPRLIDIPAVVRFVSVEPQLGDVCLEPWLSDLDWVITGGESGARHRPFDLDWARHTRDECRDAGVAWHFKQVGGTTHAAGGCELDGLETKEFPTPRAA